MKFFSNGLFSKFGLGNKGQNPEVTKPTIQRHHKVILILIILEKIKFSEQRPFSGTLRGCFPQIFF